MQRAVCYFAAWIIYSVQHSTELFVHTFYIETEDPVRVITVLWVYTQQIQHDSPVIDSFAIKGFKIERFY